MTDWNVEEAKDSIKNGGRFGAKRVMEAVYRNNIDVFRHWGYRLPDGKLVGLGDRNALLNGTKVYARAFDVNDVPHRFNAYPLNIDFGGIYSPDVAFFRHNIRDGYAFREVPFYATFGKWQGV